MPIQIERRKPFPPQALGFYGHSKKGVLRRKSDKNPKPWDDSGLGCRKVVYKIIGIFSNLDSIRHFRTE
jgi:hypothetical protein